jgi:hypothetical protein
MLLQQDVHPLQATAVPEHAQHLRDDLALSKAEVEDTVGDEHVYGCRRHRQGVSSAQPEIEVRQPQRGGIPPGLGEHLLDHIYPDDCAPWYYLPSGQDAVQASATAEVKDHLPRSKVAQSERVPNASTRLRDGARQRIN